jgi:hypothetical protein
VLCRVARAEDIRNLWVKTDDVQRAEICCSVERQSICARLHAKTLREETREAAVFVRAALFEQMPDMRRRLEFQYHEKDNNRFF